MIDLAIPLGTGSKSGNDELKLFLRSIEKYAAGIRNILVVTDHVPDWLTGVQIVSAGDIYEKNKAGTEIGYNDTAFLGGLRKALFKLFPDKSSYER